jgi:hypothetical protein
VRYFRASRCCRSSQSSTPAIKHAAAGRGTTTHSAGGGTTTHPSGGGTTTHPAGRGTTTRPAGRGTTTHAADRGASTRPAALARDKHDGGADTGQIDREGTG